MSRLMTWLCLAVAMVAYWLLSGTSRPFEECVAGIYFSGCAMLLHWLAERINL